MKHIKMNRNEFLEALLIHDQWNFSGITFVEPITLDQDTLRTSLYNQKSEFLNKDLVFDNAVFEENFFLGDFDGDIVSFADIRAMGKFGLYRINASCLSGNHSHFRGWTSIQNSKINDQINFGGARLVKGCMFKKISGSPILVINELDSAKTVFDSHEFSSVFTKGAELGKRSSVTLGELHRQVA